MHRARFAKSRPRGDGRVRESVSSAVAEKRRSGLYFSRRESARRRWASPDDGADAMSMRQMLSRVSTEKVQKSTSPMAAEGSIC